MGEERSVEEFANEEAAQQLFTNLCWLVNK
jgi:hypothetical protein